MNLIDYLRSRHETVNALTRPEAKILGFKYPLEKGWVSKYGSLEISAEIVIKLKQARLDRYAKVESNREKRKRRQKKRRSSLCRAVN